MGGYERGTAAQHVLLKKLSNREKEIVHLVFEGLSNIEISGKLFISEITVKKHLSTIYKKLEVKNPNQLIMKLMNRS